MHTNICVTLSRQVCHSVMSSLSLKTSNWFTYFSHFQQPLSAAAASAAAAVGRSRCHPPLSPVTAAAAVGRYLCRLQPLIPPVTAADAIDFHPCRTLPSSPLSPPAAARHVRPGAPVATLVCVRCSGDRGNTSRACRNPCDTFLNRTQVRVLPYAGGALGPGDQLLPGATSVGGGPGPQPGAGDNGRTRPVRKGASPALALLRPGKCLLNPATSLRLPR